MEQRVVRVAAAIILDDQDRVLTVRKRGTSMFMQPGGKPEPGETALDTIRRELAEELSLELAPDELTYVGRFVAEAANEPDHQVEAEAFLVDVRGPEVVIAAEIEELRWIEPADLERLPIAPLSTDHLLPLAWPT
ncbi:NUDIX hydrolase [Aeromicrobium sp. PE09-221]|uniref:NUDIX hydrolase n=1 Tax=Aeromicrobium sp. PE09-221 TaxID=1898043 RepID=UPI000B3E9A53|nr:NUDIX domain-containing protein [Aeromicrobium sp. PE09-221]OUZ11013.1 NUDIX hydrolase [Aeromicrobium sp. PE09-221]